MTGPSIVKSKETNSNVQNLQMRVVLVVFAFKCKTQIPTWIQNSISRLIACVAKSIQFPSVTIVVIPP